jgi:predicted transcriptional regulator
VPQLAAKYELHPYQVRRVLAIYGVRVPPNDDQDEVSAVVKKNGFFSIHDYVKQRPLSSVAEMSRELGITRGRLDRALRAHDRAANDSSRRQS